MSLRSRLAITAVLVVLVVSMIPGCGGGGNGGAPPIIVPDTGTITGRVVKADNPAASLPGSRITVSSGQSAVADAQGNFTILNVPVGAGTVTLTIESISDPTYSTQRVSGIAIAKDETTAVTVAVLPIALGQPYTILINPSVAAIDRNGEIQFAATVQGAGGYLSVQPTWYLTGSIGVIDVNGKFTGLTVGTATVVATIGSISDQANVTVTASRPPQITTMLVNPTSLPSSGGTVTVTTAVNDGDGLKNSGVVAEIVDPLNNVTTQVLPLVSGTSTKDGTFRANVTIDPNTIRQSQEDATRALTYSIRVTAEDNGGAKTTSDFQDVTVAGIDEPGPPPGL